MKSVKFGLLGLGRVVNSRILDMFNNEIKRNTVTAFYDKNRDKINKVQKILIVKHLKIQKIFLSQTLIMSISPLSQGAIIKTF